MAFEAAMQGSKLRKGPWLEEEDERLITFVTLWGERRWDSIARASGLKRSGKSCRLRWLNYLRPNIKRGHITADEEQIILELHERWGNKWARIAQRLPGRTDNEIKNYWRTHLKRKREAQGQGAFHCKPKDANQEFLQHKDCGIVEDILETKDCSMNIYGSNLSPMDSPYETRLCGWISEISNDGNEMGIQGNLNVLDPFFLYPPWNSDDRETSMLNCTDSLWDMS